MTRNEAMQIMNTLQADPSDEKLREMIIEKDREIEQLKGKVARFDESACEAMLESCRLQKENAELRTKLEAAEKVICEFQPEKILERESELMNRAEQAEKELTDNWQEYKSRSERPFNAEEILQTLHKGPGKIERIIFDAKEWERLLLAFQDLENKAKQYRADAIHLMDLSEGESEKKGLTALKDAERYRKLKKQFSRRLANNPIDGKWVVLECRLRSDFPSGDDLGLNETIDALPEIES